MAQEVQADDGGLHVGDREVSFEGTSEGQVQLHRQGAVRCDGRPIGSE